MRSPQLKLLFLTLLSLTFHLQSFAQVDSLERVKTQVSDSITLDTVQIQGDIETTIQYYAEDSIVTDLTTNKVYLYGKARVDYGNISLTAAQIEINQNNSEVTARGYQDTTGRLRDIPLFKQGDETIESDSMRYNFKTQRGIISGAVTEEGDGFVQGEKAKRMQDGVIYTKGGRYTTCNLDHPHWYIRANKIKLIPDKQVVSGPFYLVLADIPTPLGFAFGIFPFTEQRKSGLVFPVYGESADRGFFLRNGGYFWSINDYMTLDVLGEIYTRGGWGLSSTFNYRKRYRLSGNAQIRFNRRVQGEDDDRLVNDDFWLRWTHTPIPRGRSSINASVDFGTTRFNQRNEFNPTNQITNNFASSVSFRTSFDVSGTTVSLGISARQDQNSRTEIMNVTLPDVNLAVNRIYPFKKKGVSPKNFIQKINLSYTLNGAARFTNQVPSTNAFPFEVVQEETTTTNTGDSPPGFFENFPEVLRNAQVGLSHSIPISTTIKLLKYFSLNPSIRYQEVWYPKRLDYTWVDSLNAVRVDTVNRFSRTYSYSFAANLTTRIYGTFFVPKKNPNRWLQGIRHTMIPNIGFSFRPDFSKERFGFFQNVQVDSTGENFRLVSRYQNFQPVLPAIGGENGIITFMLSNIFEAKFRPRDDTSGTRKVTLLDNLSFSSNYNLVADSLNLAPINISARTRLLQKIDLNFTGTLDPYVYRALSFNEDGSVASQVRVNRFAWQEGRGIGQLRNFNVSLSTSLTPEAFKNRKQAKIDNFAAKAEESGVSADQIAQLEYIQRNPDEYVDFDIPWSLRISYNVSYSKVGFFDSQVQQQINLNGELSLTPTWKVTFRSGYDFTLKRISFTNIDIYKDLHCWEMRFNWNPFGTFQSYNFIIKVKSSVLQDLKIQRQRNFIDRNSIF